VVKISSILELEGHIGGLHAVIFDLDDTLYSEREYVRSGFSAIAKILPEIQNAEEKLYSFFESGKQAIDELLISENIYSAELQEKCLCTYRTHTPNIHLYDGVRELLLRLRKEGYMLGIITDGRPDGQRAKISALGLDTLVHEIIITDELGGIEARKPSELAFTKMCERLGKSCGKAIAYTEACYVGDNISKDFIAPKSLGMRAIWFENPVGIYK